MIFTANVTKLQWSIEMSPLKFMMKEDRFLIFMDLLTPKRVKGRWLYFAPEFLVTVAIYPILPLLASFFSKSTH